MLTLLMAMALADQDYNLGIGGRGVSFTLTEATPIEVTGPVLDGEDTEYSIWANETSGLPLARITFLKESMDVSLEGMAVALQLSLDANFIAPDVEAARIGADNNTGVLGGAYCLECDEDVFAALYLDDSNMTLVSLYQSVPSGMKPTVFEDLLGSFDVT